MSDNQQSQQERYNKITQSIIQSIINGEVDMTMTSDTKDSAIMITPDFLNGKMTMLFNACL
jgi:hypothetical protein